MKATGNMENSKYNRNYLESICGDFSKLVLKIFQEQFLDTGALELPREAKEEFVSMVIQNQFKLADELERKQKLYGDMFIDFFRESDIQGLYACYYIGQVLRLDQASKLAAMSINEAWTIRKFTEELERKMDEVENEKQRRLHQ